MVDAILASSAKVSLYKTLLQLRMNLDPQIALLQNQCSKKGSTKRAQTEKTYLKSELKHYGVSVPKLRKIAKNWYRNNSHLNFDDYFNICFKLWHSEYFEERSLSLYLLELRASELCHEHIYQLEEMIHQATTWAHVDQIAINLVGAIIEKDRSSLILLPIWAKSDNFWVRRVAIIAQLKLFRVGKGNMKVFRDVVVPMFNETKYWTKQERFFIRKAIGWALRERTKADPDSVITFVNTYKDKMAALTYRESVRNLSSEETKKLQPL